MTHVTCRLTAKNRDQLRNPTLGNRVWATFTFLLTLKCDVVSTSVLGCGRWRAVPAKSQAEQTTENGLFYLHYD